MRKIGIAALLLIGAATAQTQPPVKPPLIPCAAGQNIPCVVLATKPDDVVGVWKQYTGNPAFAPVGNMAFLRINLDGTFALGTTVEGTRTPTAPFPYGTYRFEGSRMILSVQGVAATAMPECAKAVHEVRVLRLGTQPVALSYTMLEDTCKPRIADLSQAVIYVGPNQ